MSLNEFNTMNEIGEYIIDNFPDMQTGTKQTINSLINQSIQTVENSLNVTIDTNAIENKYQPIITDLSYSKVLEFDVSQNSTGNIKLGDFTVDSGQNKKVMLATTLKQSAMDSLRELKRRITFKRVIGA